MTLPIAFINLDRDTERHALLQEQLRLRGLHGERLSATWWNDVPPTEQDHLYAASLNAKQYFKPLVNGEKGCYTSHINAWKQLLSSPDKALVVLEDDVVLDAPFVEVLQAIEALEDDWDMIKLMGRPSAEKILQQGPLTAYHHLIQYQRVPSFTAAYVVSRRGAQKLLKSRLPFGRPIDIDLRFWWENDLQILGVFPPVVQLHESSAESSIGGREAGTTLATRLRKLKMKAQLTLGNHWHLRKVRLPGKQRVK